MPDTTRGELKAPNPQVGLILTGGGARAAYQVGVLKAIAELMPEDVKPVPFSIICGTSAGAINAATLACQADNFRQAVAKLLTVWDNFHTYKVFRTEPRIAFVSGLHWLLSLLFGGLGRFTPKSVLDNTPLRDLLQEQLRFQDIQYWIDRGILHAFSITAAAYYSGYSVTFYQGHDDIQPWKRTRRIGIPRPITLDHLMASSAIPILFPAVRIGYDYYGDGSMGQTAPLSPALHLGADRLLVIGVRNERPDNPNEIRYRLTPPSLGQISGYILDTLFMDSLSMDIERLKRVNHTLHHIPDGKKNNIPLRPIDLLTIFPSRDIRPITERHAKDFPRSVRYLLRGIGAMNRGGRPLMSYLLFEQAFCRELIELGYHDARRLHHQILRLLAPEKKSPRTGMPVNPDVSRETS